MSCTLRSNASGLPPAGLGPPVTLPPTSEGRRSTCTRNRAGCSHRRPFPLIRFYVLRLQAVASDICPGQRPPSLHTLLTPVVSHVAMESPDEVPDDRPRIALATLNCSAVTASGVPSRPRRIHIRPYRQAGLAPSSQRHIQCGAQLPCPRKDQPVFSAINSMPRDILERGAVNYFRGKVDGSRGYEGII